MINATVPMAGVPTIGRSSARAAASSACGAIEGVGQLSEVEYEIAFLLTLGYNADAIARVLPRLRAGPNLEVGPVLSRITDRMAAAAIEVASMRDHLIEARIHQRMPKSFFDQVVRSRG